MADTPPTAPRRLPTAPGRPSACAPSQPSARVWGLGWRLALVTVLAWLGTVVGDLPVHCERDDIIGEWVFELTREYDHRTSCGHSHPDDERCQPLHSSFNGTRTIGLKLTEPNKCEMDDGSRCSWTMVYDEAWDVNAEDLTFLAFSHFRLVQPSLPGQNTPKDSICTETEVGWFHNWATDKWGCYKGRMTKRYQPEDKKSPSSLDKRRTDIVMSRSSVQHSRSGISAALGRVARGARDAIRRQFMPLAFPSLSWRRKGARRPSGTLEPGVGGGEPGRLKLETREGYGRGGGESPLSMLFVQAIIDKEKPLSLAQHQTLVDHLNRVISHNKGSWKAAVYPQFAGKSFEQLNRMAGLPRDAQQRHFPPPHMAVPAHPHTISPEDFIQTAASVTLASKHYANRTASQHRHSDEAPISEPSAHLYRGSDVDTAEFMDNFSWGSQMGGANFMRPAVDQGDCGSCYLVSTINMLNARWKIKHPDDRDFDGFSEAFGLSCSEYNQGCKGGYPFMVVKWMSEVGLLPRRCGGYTAQDNSCHKGHVAKSFRQCLDNPRVPKYRVARYGYVGGYYGGCTEELMMQELYKNGPITVSIEPTPDFMYYHEGVFSEGGEVQHTDWIKVDHAVLLVGWGLEKGANPLRYWLVQNSWGTNWGLNGYFKIERGRNIIGIESDGVFADVDKIQHSPATLSSFYHLLSPPKKDDIAWQYHDTCERSEGGDGEEASNLELARRREQQTHPINVDSARNMRR
ncbi:unnamed protein product [Vitrella brassicaformis CCMP3155]|uniref:Dipeptidyl peptidase 1 n=2 Tax=Vitrella brassicaformis TaxID=1169539 RepID=A0A0G4F8H7_VITBC|nr:unnamed protein product [Vitrella brassicaformis CCMP3155]|eukprot:CEM08677.1 unnamed protein product [Vitrella brassicaformis CCMP3155]